MDDDTVDDRRKQVDGEVVQRMRSALTFRPAAEGASCLCSNQAPVRVREGRAKRSEPIAAGSCSDNSARDGNGPTSDGSSRGLGPSASPLEEALDIGDVGREESGESKSRKPG